MEPNEVFSEFLNQMEWSLFKYLTGCELHWIVIVCNSWDVSLFGPGSCMGWAARTLPLVSAEWSRERSLFFGFDVQFGRFRIGLGFNVFLVVVFSFLFFWIFCITSFWFAKFLLKSQLITLWGFPCVLFVAFPLLLLMSFSMSLNLSVWLLCVSVCCSLGLSCLGLSVLPGPGWLFPFPC